MNDQDGETALHYAAKSELEGFEKIQFLVENGADVNIHSRVSIMVSFLWLACVS